MYENGVNYNVFRAVLVGKALVLYAAEELNKKMVFTLSSFDVTKDFEDKVTWKDVSAAFAVCLPFFTYGIATTLLSLSSEGEALWNQTGLILGAALSAPVLCYTIDKCGRKIGIFIVNLVQGTTCIPLFLVPSVANVITVHVLTGISSGGLFTILPIYMRETFPKKIRSVSLALISLMVSAGYMMKLAMGEEALMLTMVALVMIQILTLYIMVESPSYLIIANKIEAVTSVVAKLKNLPKESPAVTHEVSILKQESERARANGRITLLSFFKNRIWLDITKIGIMLFTIKELCGSIIFLDQDKTLAQLELPSDPDRMLVVTAWCTGCVFCLVVISFVERKIRATLIGLLYTYSELIKLAHVHSFQYIEDYMGTYTVFYIFACINLFAAVYALFAIPDIKNKSVRQIERQLKRIPIWKL
ncbi:uncharacterized protein LOC128679889 isoform X2 [Plodia interpunctella]|uniref:uncharacterized protein LOC128679889 isoform X2 n=1 Tax=Plodia interpunctella TaxID=58824 RepID=UPI00236792AD|nr:uncharacterized protein LOC128679889 isoform X2 [Plodia interpunctella]